MAKSVNEDDDDDRGEIGADDNSPDASSASPPPPLPLLGSVRLRVTIMGLFGFFNMYAQRVNLSVALVAMVNSNSTNATIDPNGTCPVDDGGGGHVGRSLAAVNSTTRVNAEPLGEFADWDSTKQAIILGSFFYGYIVTQIPGGILAKRFGGKILYGIGGLCTSVFTLLTPLAARISWKCLVAVRIIEGLGEGVTFPAMNSLFSDWSPPSERSRHSTIAFGGAQLGTIVALPIGGLLCQYVSWDSVFYVFGVLGIFWFALWMYLVSNSPATCRFIKSEEKDYIQWSLARERGSLTEGSTPWCNIWTSPRVWAIVIAHFAQNWSFYTLLTETPSFLKDILHFNIKENGFLSALPYVLQWIIIITSGLVADYLRKNCLSTGMVRKLMSIVGFGMTALSLLGLAYVGCNKVLAIVLLVGATGFCGANFSGFNCNHLDIAPQYAGILLGITNCVATIPGFAGPAVVGMINDPAPTLAGWQTVFVISACVSLFGLFSYLLLGSGEVQPWAKSPPDLLNPCCGDAPEERRLLDSRPRVYDDDEN